MPVTRRQIESASTPAQRAQLRAQAIAESDDRPTFTVGDYTIVVTEGPTLVGTVVRTAVQVTYLPIGTVIPLADANPFLFVNPPTNVPTGTFHADPETGDPVPDFTFAPRLAFRKALGDAVVDAVRRSRWRP